LWNFNNGGCKDGSGPGEVEEQGAEGHSWLNTTYPLMMMMMNCDLTKWPVELFSQEGSKGFLQFQNVHLSRHQT